MDHLTCPQVRAYIANVDASLEEFKTAFLVELGEYPSPDKVNQLHQVLLMFMVKYMDTIRTIQMVNTDHYVKSFFK